MTAFFSAKKKYYVVSTNQYNLKSNMKIDQLFCKK
jgi:hypothetical protein